MMRAPIIRLVEIWKAFGPTIVLRGVSLDVYPGEVLCLLGDNGAGKSTLIKIMAGVHEPSGGRVEIDGRPVTLKSPRHAQRFGISTVHQFGGTFPLMSVGRSFFVGAEPTKGWGPLKRFDRKTANEIAVTAVQGLGLKLVDGETLVGVLSGGERQALAIARAVYFGARVLILDEPTASLGVKEAAHVLRIIMQARQRGVAVVLVTHHVTHAMAVGDRFAVLIRGALAASFARGERSREEITDLMAGGEAMAELESEIESLLVGEAASYPPAAG